MKVGKKNVKRREQSICAEVEKFLEFFYIKFLVIIFSFKKNKRFEKLKKCTNEIFE